MAETNPWPEVKSDKYTTIRHRDIGYDGDHDVMAETNPEAKSDKYTTIRHHDIGCDGEQRSLIPKWQGSEEQRKKVNII